MKKELEDYYVQNIMTKITLEILAETIDKLAISTGKSFKYMEERFDGIDQRFDWMDKRLDRMDRRFDGLDATMEHGFAELGSRLTSVERRTTLLESK